MELIVRAMFRGGSQATFHLECATGTPLAINNYLQIVAKGHSPITGRIVTTPIHRTDGLTEVGITIACDDVHAMLRQLRHMPGVSQLSTS